MPRGARPCDRKRCRGEMHEQAWSHEADGRHVFLVCDLDTRHTLDLHEPLNDERQQTLDLEPDRQEQHP